MAGSAETNSQVGLNGHETPSIGMAGLSGNAGTLKDWLGSFWGAVHVGGRFVDDLQRGRALRIAQLKLDLMEALESVDRESAPVFHRERWHPVVVRRSERNTGAGTMFRLGDGSGLPLGEVDESNDILVPGSVARLGSRGSLYSGMVVYPLSGESSGIVQGATCVVDSISDARTTLVRGQGFETFDGFIAIASWADPFPESGEGPFERFVTRDSGDPEDDGYDEEAVLWVCDAMFDRDMVETHVGYAMGLSVPSTPGHRRIVNAVWNAVSSGGTPLAVKALLASLCGIPTVGSDGEVVQTVSGTHGGGFRVVTTGGVYDFPPGDSPRRGVVPGARLDRFDMLDTSIRVYPCVRDAGSVGLWSEFAGSPEEFMEDVPCLNIPAHMLGCGASGGFSVGWDEEDVVFEGLDANGGPKLRFRLEGSDSDNALFWNEVWSRCEAEGVSMASMLDCGGLPADGTMPPAGTPCGKVSPLGFFLSNLIGANTIVATVRTDLLPDGATLHDPAYFGALMECIPANVRLVVVERVSAPVEDGGALDVSDVGSVDDSVSACASCPVSDSVRVSAMGEWTAARLVPSCVAL